MTSIEVKAEEQFCASLADGVVLCRIAKAIEGSNMKKFNDPVKNEFKKRENLVKFQESCKALGLPFVCRVDHIVNNKLDPVVSCLLGLARVAASQESIILPEAIMEKIEAMEALEATALADNVDDSRVATYAEAEQAYVCQRRYRWLGAADSHVLAAGIVDGLRHSRKRDFPQRGTSQSRDGKVPRQQRRRHARAR